jgi:hypothetical protein
MVTRAAVPATMLATMLALGAAACGSDADSASVPGTQAPEPAAAADLAPSQTAASTVAAPDVPPPCDLDDLHWVAEPPTRADALFVVRVRNAGEIECELDVSQSEVADPAMEPDVWLAPGATGELTVVDTAPGCTEPDIDPWVELVANGTPVVVPLDTVELAPWCQPSAIAIYVV